MRTLTSMLLENASKPEEYIENIKKLPSSFEKISRSEEDQKTIAFVLRKIIEHIDVSQEHAQLSIESIKILALICKALDKRDDVQYFKALSSVQDLPFEIEDILKVVQKMNFFNAQTFNFKRSLTKLNTKIENIRKEHQEKIYLELRHAAIDRKYAEMSSEEVHRRMEALQHTLRKETHDENIKKIKNELFDKVREHEKIHKDKEFSRTKQKEKSTQMRDIHIEVLRKHEKIQEEKEQKQMAEQEEKRSSHDDDQTLLLKGIGEQQRDIEKIVSRPTQEKIQKHNAVTRTVGIKDHPLIERHPIKDATLDPTLQSNIHPTSKDSTDSKKTPIDIPKTTPTATWFCKAWIAFFSLFCGPQQKTAASAKHKLFSESTSNDIELQEKSQSSSSHLP